MGKEKLAKELQAFVKEFLVPGIRKMLEKEIQETRILREQVDAALAILKKYDDYDRRIKALEGKVGSEIVKHIMEI